MKLIYNKLIRDRIPEIISVQGKRYSVRVLAEEAYLEALAAKLVEEAQEVQVASNQGQRKDILKELADLSEVMDALRKALEIADDEIQELQSKRKAERGGFDHRLWLEWVEEPESSQ